MIPHSSRPLSRSLARALALCAATHLSLAPALLPFAVPAAFAETATVSTSNLTAAIAALSSSNIQEVQTRYNELVNLIAAKKVDIGYLTNADDITAANTELANMESLEKALKAILDGYAASNAKTVVSTTTTTDATTGDIITRTTYSDGSYTETVTASTTNNSGNLSSDSSEDSSDDSSSGNFLEQMLQNPIIQLMIADLIQKLLNGSLGNLSDLMNNLFGTASNVPTPGTVCDPKKGQKCSGSDYTSPNPQSGS